MVGEHDSNEEFSSQRRSLFKAAGLMPAQIASLFMKDSFVPTANARGLVKFPCKGYQFLNTYHFVRAGESLLEEENIWLTNPLFL